MNASSSKALLATVALAGAAMAQTQVSVTADITTSTTWTANNRYILQNQIYVAPGASLTIEAGTVITSPAGGSLAVTRGGQIFVNGTEQAPVIFTSINDYNTWTNGDPKTGTWRPVANEWGNLTLMGRAYISENVGFPNTPTPNAGNVAQMEGLLAAFPGDQRVLYGGGNDDDDSGSISYCSIRYTGVVTGLNVELNGLALGGVGRNTEIHHIDINNGVDDGIEIWGGTVNLKYVSIWNVGDDSFDVDQGWRGRLQFGVIVQGYSADAAQGSGRGDNAFELDGAEQSDYQPVTTSSIYNVTVIGSPTIAPTSGSGGCDHLVAYRDGARVQFYNSIFMDAGERVLNNDNVDGDGGLGYGHNGTLSWASCWTTPYTSYSTVNAPANPAAFYTAQTQGNLIEWKDNVFYNNVFSSAYSEANARGVFGAGNNNVQATAMPIQVLTRAAAVPVGGATNLVARVSLLDPRPANDALTAVGHAPAGFYDAAKYRGAIAPGGSNWLLGWTAADAYGFLVRGDNWADLGESAPGGNGAPVLAVAGSLSANTPTLFSIQNGPAAAFNAFCFGFSRIDFDLGPIGFPGVTVVPNINTLGYVGTVSPTTTFTMPVGFTGLPFYVQAVVFDNTAPNGLSATNAIFKIAP